MEIDIWNRVNYTPYEKFKKSNASRIQMWDCWHSEIIICSYSIPIHDYLKIFFCHFVYSDDISWLYFHFQVY